MVLKEQSPLIEYYYRSVKPNIHYVPFTKDDALQVGRQARMQEGRQASLTNGMEYASCLQDGGMRMGPTRQCESGIDVTSSEHSVSLVNVVSCKGLQDSIPWQLAEGPDFAKWLVQASAYLHQLDVGVLVCGQWVYA